MTNAFPDGLTIKPINHHADMRVAYAIRKLVFVDEQQVDPQIEYDQFENTSKHFLVAMNHDPVGTARWRYTANGAKIERVAILPAYRHKGIATLLTKFVINNIPHDAALIYLHSQEQVMHLYQKLGFEPIGERFWEAGIPHFKMILKR